MDARASHHSRSAGPLLLNPIFRWAFLGRCDKLEALESGLAYFKEAVGSAEFERFRDELCDDLRGIDVENQAHNRLLSAWAEIRAVPHFGQEGSTVELIPRAKKKTPDFRVIADGVLKLVEVKYLRPPDKLGEYLVRWWQAQRDISRKLPRELGSLPHIKFEWKFVASRNELSAAEINLLDDFFSKVFLHPAK